MFIAEKVQHLEDKIGDVSERVLTTSLTVEDMRKAYTGNLATVNDLVNQLAAALNITETPPSG